MRSQSRQVRCAIYTRKSSDEGLEQSFNSLDAQREACAAYILSQASEGWTALPAVYDDGGLSGGTLERPALQRLLGEVAGGRVDIIVVYKVDRLTRSLFDFAKLVELLDKAGTSFVSVTQSFNTTTSMGRLTLNMLLSFAQFEREVTAERIRDKIAASKVRGMWMGGTPPLGYAPDGRTLAIVPAQAELVRHLFDRYLALGSVRLVEDELRRAGTALPVRIRAKDGASYGGGWFTRGQIYKILGNPIYTGRIPHGERLYPGLHPAIVDAHVWEQVQAKLADGRQGNSQRVRARVPSLLAGRVVDGGGEPLIAVHASKPVKRGGSEGATRYRYYVSRALHHGEAGEGMRIPAVELEAVVTGRLVEALGDPLALAAAAGMILRSTGLTTLTARAQDLADELRRKGRAVCEALIATVRINSGTIAIDCHAAALAERLGLELVADATAIVTITAKVTLTRTGRALRLVQHSAAPPCTPDRALIRLLVQARRWWAVLREGRLNTTDLARREGVTPSYLARVVRLAFLAPEVTQAILAGGQRAGVTVASLTIGGEVPADWQVQKTLLLAAGLTR